MDVFRSPRLHCLCSFKSCRGSCLAIIASAGVCVSWCLQLSNVIVAYALPQCAHCRVFHLSLACCGCGDRFTCLSRKSGCPGCAVGRLCAKLVQPARAMSVSVPQPLHKVALAEGSFGQAAKSLATHLLACGGPVAASPSPSPPCTLTEAVPGWEGQLVDPEVSSRELIRPLHMPARV